MTVMVKVAVQQIVEYQQAYINLLYHLYTEIPFPLNYTKVSSFQEWKLRFLGVHKILFFIFLGVLFVRGLIWLERKLICRVLEYTGLGLGSGLQYMY